MATYPKLATFKNVAQLQQRLTELGISLPLDEELVVGLNAPLGQPLTWFASENQASAKTIGNRFAILPMEGWDGTPTGKPTAQTFRRWQRFGSSGAKLIWGGEAVAVRQDGRANPNQLLLHAENRNDFEKLRLTLLESHEQHHGTTDDLFIGLQLTHSGRWARPNQKDRLEPRTVYVHPLLDQRFAVYSAQTVLTDAQIDEIIADFIQAGQWAAQIGFQFVDIKCCHGYLGHEFLTAHHRPGQYGGNYENRTRFLREILTGIRQVAPTLQLGVRLSLFDFLPFQKGADQIGEPMPWPVTSTDPAYNFGFGVHPEHPTEIDLREPFRLLDDFVTWGVQWLCTTAGCPYYNPHIQRPAAFPPSDGYLPPEDPLVGVARQIAATAQAKRHQPKLHVIGSGYSYLQEFLPLVGQRAVRDGMTDFIGLGRMVLSYPEMPSEVLQGKPLARKQICRTFSDCTTAPRNGLVSGCYPLDPFYKQSPEYEQMIQIKQKHHA